MRNLRFTIRRNDRLPAIALQATYDDGSAVDLTGATNVVFRMRAIGSADGDTPKVAAAATVTDAAAGKVRYAWAAGDTDTAGTYTAEIELQLSGQRLTFPAQQVLTVQVVEDLGQ